MISITFEDSAERAAGDPFGDVLVFSHKAFDPRKLEGRIRYHCLEDMEYWSFLKADATNPEVLKETFLRNFDLFKQGMTRCKEETKACLEDGIFEKETWENIRTDLGDDIK